MWALAPIAWQIREMEPEGFALDSIVTVIDCVNFTGYEDTSYTAKLQAQYTDVILLNKHELVSSDDLLRGSIEKRFMLKCICKHI